MLRPRRGQWTGGRLECRGMMLTLWISAIWERERSIGDFVKVKGVQNSMTSNDYVIDA